MLLLLAGLCVWVVVTLQGARIPASGSRQQVLYYGAPASLRPGARMEQDELLDRLHRLGYHQVESLGAPGDFVTRASRFEIYLRPFAYPSRPFAGGRVRLSLGDGAIARCEAEPAVAPDECRLEPERIAGFQGDVGAVLAPLKLDDAPPLLVKTILAVEDRRFYHHPGIDPIGTARAVVANFRRRGLGQGGSTLTQQLARSLYLHNHKTLWRKAQEAMLALGLELRYSKAEILEGYLNAVYWGYWGSYEIRGAREAARYYLGKELDEYRVDGPSPQQVADIALLVGLIQAPNAYSPYNSAEKAKQRRDRVLHVMVDQKVITQPVADAAMARPLPAKRRPAREVDASYFLDAVRAEVARRASPDLVGKPGTIFFTTLDPRDQAAAEQSVKQGLADLERDHKKLRRKTDPLEAAALVIDPSSGAVRALVGGRDYLTSPFNRAIDARRQPGSLFKPFVFFAALRERQREAGGYWTPATLLDDSPFSVKLGRKSWRPQNYDREFHGEITLRETLEQSRNVPTARVAQEIGIEKVVEAAYDLGVVSPLKKVPSLALGASEVSLLEMTSAYGTLAAGGVGHQPTTLVGVVASGHPVDLAPLRSPRWTRPSPGDHDQPARRGDRPRYRRRARELGVDGAVAGKSGRPTTIATRGSSATRPVAPVACGSASTSANWWGCLAPAAALPIWSSIMRQVDRRRISPTAGRGHETDRQRDRPGRDRRLPCYREEVFSPGPS
ncbi:MAG: transglycosylase domain-containing protein [Candidatus Eisenbacteria bacterium]